MISGGKRHEISAEDHIFASIMLYLDVVYIFMYILMLLGKREWEMTMVIQSGFYVFFKTILHCIWFNSFLTSLSVWSSLTCLSFVSMYRLSSRWCFRLVFLLSCAFSDLPTFSGLITLVDGRKTSFFLLLDRFRNKQIEVSLRCSSAALRANHLFECDLFRVWKKAAVKREEKKHTHTNSFARGDTTIVHECRILSVCRLMIIEEEGRERE